MAEPSIVSRGVQTGACIAMDARECARACVATTHSPTTWRACALAAPLRHSPHHRRRPPQPARRPRPGRPSACSRSCSTQPRPRCRCSARVRFVCAMCARRGELSVDAYAQLPLNMLGACVAGRRLLRCGLLPAVVQAAAQGLPARVRLPLLRARHHAPGVPRVQGCVHMCRVLGPEGAGLPLGSRRSQAHCVVL
jgi:hypothetical protein